MSFGLVEIFKSLKISSIAIKYGTLYLHTYINIYTSTTHVGLNKMFW